ncbi:MULTISPECIES: aconitate hydratase AcnA [Citricoccus]|uniref:aconitate hydratase AcnA n=1 Tax=Citricoccus TaxID=169133 RepID=UPI0002F11B2B|nr:aconitate hydratase AcnA [Citricoccus sp. CH26A]
MTGTITGPAGTAAMDVGGRSFRYVDITRVDGADSLPVSLKILLENLLRHGAGAEAVHALVTSQTAHEPAEIPFNPARVVMQDMAGAPVVHDLLTLREAMGRLGADPARITPLVPAELVVDHSVIVDNSGTRAALRRNTDREFERNEERFRFLRWAQGAFEGLRVVPPGQGIIHQVNIEYLARGVMTTAVDGETLAYPDTCIGTDSHTTMVNGLGILGWGVGGIEAVSALLGQPLSLLVPPVVGVEFHGELPVGTTATDLVLTVTEQLRAHGVVGKIVEFHGPGLRGIPVADRATIANMSPEFGSTAAMFPVDAATVEYYRMTGRPASQVELIEAYARAQGLWGDGTGTSARYAETLQLDLSTVVPSIAGPYRPQDRIALEEAGRRFRADVATLTPEEHRAGAHPVEVDVEGSLHRLGHGTLAIAAITSCTNTSNPQVMMTAALLARNAVARGLRVPPWVKTSLAPGSQVVTSYLERAGLLPSLEALGFHVVGYGCTTCMGNSGPLAAEMTAAARDHGLVLASVLSGNRNFEGRVSPDVRMNYLASPPLVVGYALAGTVDIDLVRDPLGCDAEGREVRLPDLWPSAAEVERELSRVVTSELYEDGYRDVFTGSPLWEGLEVPRDDGYDFGESTYLRPSPFLDGVGPELEPVRDLEGARVLVSLGDSVTTDHISPVGPIRADSPAGRYLREHGVAGRDFNTYGARRGNHEVMVRGTFANVRLRNRLLDGQEGGYTRMLPTGEELSIFDASQLYAQQGTPLLVLAGRDYGSGSARDYAAKGTRLLGVRVVLAESYERIHRSNLVGMGVIPLQYRDGDTAASLGLDGTEEYTVTGLAGFTDSWPRTVRIEARAPSGRAVTFDAVVRVDTPAEADYVRHGGILPYALRAGLRPAH